MQIGYRKVNGPPGVLPVSAHGSQKSATRAALADGSAYMCQEPDAQAVLAVLTGPLFCCTVQIVFPVIIP